jgi:hypothetical protein
MPVAAMPSPDRPRGLGIVIKEHPIVVAVTVLLGTAATAIPLSISLTERWNETIATIDMGSVDQKKPFSAPLEIKNASTIFEMHAPAMSCAFSTVYADGTVPSLTQNGGTTGWHALPTVSVPVKSSVIFFCDLPDKFKYTTESGNELTLQSATMTISTKYKTWLFFWPLERQPQPTTFTLLNTSSGYQWVKGTLIK